MRLPALSLLLVLGLSPRSVAAVTFDASGSVQWDEAKVAGEGFEQATPEGVTCEDPCSYESITADDELALEGQRYLRLSTQQGSFTIDFSLPKQNESYRFSVWVRHARVWARVVFEHDDTLRGTESAWMFPSGRVTSDGWVELVSNPTSVTGRDVVRSYLRIEGTDVDLDVFEAVPEGEYAAGGACLGAFDPICGPEALCIGERCRQGARFVPPLPPSLHRASVARYLAERVRTFFGGRRTRAEFMPQALAQMESMTSAQTPWQFWSGFARGVRMLHDWHTSAGAPIGGQSGRRLGVCFIEGEADLTQATWPSQAGRADILVSHVGPDGTLGLGPGDRLVAVDGKHPLDWAHGLRDVNWGYHVATDPEVDAELAEALRDLIPRYAKSFSVLRCNPGALSCSSVIETMDVTSIEIGIQPPVCDNRPAYHLANPPENEPGTITTYHHVPFYPWRDLVVDSQPGEKIYGMTFDTLYGGPSGLTQFFQASNDFFKQNARGVIIDHRAGNGGTIDAPQALTELLRAPENLCVGPTFMSVAAYDGPATQAEGAALAQQLATSGAVLYQVGSNAPDTSIPVALIIHRDGSASDWLPLGFKGAPKARVFGPHQTAGAFSSFYQFSYWSRLDFQLASGDTLLFDGTPLIGHGVEPDQVVNHTQTSLLQGKDAPYEAALTWVRSQLKP